MKYTKKQKQKAIEDCIKSGQDPYDHHDYSDLRRDKEKWQYFLESENK